MLKVLLTSTRMKEKKITKRRLSFGDSRYGEEQGRFALENDVKLINTLLPSQDQFSVKGFETSMKGVVEFGKREHIALSDFSRLQT